MIARSLKCTAERNQRFVAERTANELHPDRQSRFRLPRRHHQARQAEKVHRPHEAGDGLDRRLRACALVASTASTIRAAALNKAWSGSSTFAIFAPSLRSVTMVASSALAMSGSRSSI